MGCQAAVIANSLHLGDDHGMEDFLTRNGWVFDSADGFIAHIGGLWHLTNQAGNHYGFVTRDIHANRNGVVHGGMIMSFVDRAFGMHSRLSSGSAKSATVSLSHQFVAPLQLGKFAALTPRIVKLTPRMAFIEGTVMCDDQPIVQAQGVWRLARRDA